ncbi:MAG: hypothetical protein GX775_04355 [Erysipelothrix sp.]|nr:hypothetical protein [Erysipelothrix sp.]
MKRVNWLIGLLCSFLLVGCVARFKVNHAYLSFVVSTSEKNDVYYYSLDDETSKPELVDTLPLTSQALYYERGNAVLYSSKENQLVYHDLEEDSHQVLTDTLLAINSIVPLGNDKVFLAAVEKGAASLAVQPYLVDLKSKEPLNLSWNSDFDIRLVNVNSKDNSLILSGYSLQDEIEHDSTFFQLKDGVFSKLFTISDSPRWFYIKDNEIHYQGESSGELHCMTLDEEVCEVGDSFVRNPIYYEKEDAYYSLLDRSVVRSGLESDPVELFEFDNVINNMILIQGGY